MTTINDKERLQRLLDGHGEDVREAIEELYGAVWFLASVVAGYHLKNGDNIIDAVASFVEMARQNYRDGLEMSPLRREDS